MTPVCPLPAWLAPGATGHALAAADRLIEIVRGGDAIEMVAPIRIVPGIDAGDARALEAWTPVAPGDLRFAERGAVAKRTTMSGAQWRAVAKAAVHCASPHASCLHTTRRWRRLDPCA